MVDCQGPPVDSPDSRAALVYVAGYVSGIAFSDRRILSDNGQEIELYMWDYRTNSEATIRLTPDEFIRRFSSHILPSSVSRVRHSGMYHGKLKAKKLALCRELLAQGNQRPLFLEYSLRGPSTTPATADHPAEYSLLAALGLDAADIADGAFDSADLRHIADSRDIQPTDDELQEVRTYFARTTATWPIGLGKNNSGSSVWPRSEPRAVSIE